MENEVVEAQTGAFRVALKLLLFCSLTDFYYWNIKRGFYLLLYVLLLSASANKRKAYSFLDQGPLMPWAIMQSCLWCTYCSYARHAVILCPFCQKIKERKEKAYCLRKTIAW